MKADVQVWCDSFNGTQVSVWCANSLFPPIWPPLPVQMVTHTPCGPQELLCHQDEVYIFVVENVRSEKNKLVFDN